MLLRLAIALLAVTRVGAFAPLYGRRSLELPTSNVVAKWPYHSRSQCLVRGRTPGSTSKWLLHSSGAASGDDNFDEASSNDSSDDNDNGGNDEGIVNKVQRWLADPEVKEDLKSYATSLTLALLLRFFVVEPRFIPSLSMYPTFDIGDQLAVEKVSHFMRPYARNDVVVFTPPEAFIEITGKENYKSEALIKRVVATAGDVVEVKNRGTLYVNGVAQQEAFTYEKAFYDLAPLKVPPGCLLVLGDNRNHSLDGHIWGFLPTENVIGRAIFKYWPVWRAGGVETAPVDL